MFTFSEPPLHVNCCRNGSSVSSIRSLSANIQSKHRVQTSSSAACFPPLPAFLPFVLQLFSLVALIINLKTGRSFENLFCDQITLKPGHFSVVFSSDFPPSATLTELQSPVYQPPTPLTPQTSAHKCSLTACRLFKPHGWNN